jgi:hypothetical protein
MSDCGGVRLSLAAGDDHRIKRHRRSERAATVFLDLIARIVLTNGKRFLHTGVARADSELGRRTIALRSLCFFGPANLKINSNREGKEDS